MEGESRMSKNVIRIADYERKSRNADAVQPRDPADADVIILPVIRRFGQRELPSVFLPDNAFHFENFK